MVPPTESSGSLSDRLIGRHDVLDRLCQSNQLHTQDTPQPPTKGPPNSLPARSALSPHDKPPTPLSPPNRINAPF
eukprot:scaffold1539_cov191-Alexandrium_tamarense.AAC.6